MLRLMAVVCMLFGLSCGGDGPTTPAPPSSIEAFENAGARLAYVIDRPAGAGPFSGVVLGHERGQVTRAQLQDLSAQLVQAGFVVLRFDRRGTGQSTGIFEDISVANSQRVVDTLASDLVAAVQTLRTQSAVNATSIGLVGPSEAGWVMPRAATLSSDVHFVAAIVSPTVSVGVRNRFAELASDASRTTDQLSMLLADFAGPFGYDPRAVLVQMTIPSLWIFATDDRIVPTRESRAILEALRPGGGPMTIVELPGTHDLRHTTAYVSPLTTWLATVR